MAIVVTGTTTFEQTSRHDHRASCSERRREKNDVVILPSFCKTQDNTASRVCGDVNPSPPRIETNPAYLKAFGFGRAPELLKVFDAVVDGVHDDEGEEAVVQGLLEGLQQTAAVRVLHLRFVLVLQHLRVTICFMS